MTDNAERLIFNVWVKDTHGCLNLHTLTPDGARVHAFIQARPAYCDRGHWQANIDGPLEIDGSDRFPRYYFSLDQALEETERFLQWRIHRARAPVESLDDMAGRVFVPMAGRR